MRITVDLKDADLTLRSQIGDSWECDFSSNVILTGPGQVRLEIMVPKYGEEPTYHYIGRSGPAEKGKNILKGLRKFCKEAE
jgi:hypothetical protein